MKQDSLRSLKDKLADLPWREIRRRWCYAAIRKEYGSLPLWAKSLGVNDSLLRQVCGGFCRSLRVEKDLAQMTGVPHELLFCRDEAA